MAHEKAGDTYSIFTKHLLEGLQTRAADLDHAADGQITIDALYRYAYHQVRQEGSQEAMRWDLNRKGNILEAVYKRYNLLKASVKQQYKSYFRISSDCIYHLWQVVFGG